MFLVLLTGCATQTRALLQQAPEHLPRRAELTATPFFPQERYQCGPATLAMALHTAGIEVGVEALVPQVYVPQREGSLQTEMLAAARRNGAVGMTIAPKLGAALEEVAAGHPVIVLQNLSLSLLPVWHYALLIGYDLDREEVVLRSGTTERLVMPISTFEHTWGRSGFWAMAALSPGRLPVTVGEESAVDALVAFEKASERVGAAGRARVAYEAALRRWPRNLTLQLGYGNASYAAGDRVAAATAFRGAAQQHPDSAPAFNNLASVLLELGEVDAARAAAEKAVALGGPWQAAALATLREVESAQRVAKP